MKLAQRLERLGEWNPQFWREGKGRLKPLNLMGAIAGSVIVQVLVYFYFTTLIPSSSSYVARFRYPLINRYCTGEGQSYSWPTCIRDLSGNFIIFKELWWLDLFTALSYGLVIGLLVLGTYLLIVDLTKEEASGTLNFIRLSPQSAASIIWGKILGVPLLIYLTALLVIPLHLIAGLGADIPLGLILAFYGILIASCACFYQLAVVIALSSTKISHLLGMLISAGVGMYLWVSSLILSAPSNPIHWLALFNPLLSLPYLTKSTFIPEQTHRYYFTSGEILWYNQPLFSSAALGVTLIILHYSFWSYWLSQAIYRRFANPRSSFLNKIQSYWLTGFFSLIGLGFILNLSKGYGDPSANFVIFQVLCFIWIIFLTLAISPRRQHLLDWSRYHHHNWLKDLLMGEKSPSTVAMVVNVAIILTIIVPAILLSPLGEDRSAILFCFLAGMNMTLIYAALSQWLLMSKRIKQGVMALGITGLLTLLPLAVFGISAKMYGHIDSAIWLFSALPVLAGEYVTFSQFALALLGQWLVMIVMGSAMARQLRQAGMSATKALVQG